MTNIGITGGGNDTHMIYLDGKKNNVVKNVDLENYLEDLIRKKTKEIEYSNWYEIKISKRHTWYIWKRNR